MIHIASREAKSLETQASQDATVSPDDHSEREPPDPMPNSEVKPLSADGSVEFLHVRVGHRQALIPQKTQPIGWVFCFSMCRFMSVFLCQNVNSKEERYDTNAMGSVTFPSTPSR